MARTVLNVTPDTRRHAKANGARWDASKREWFVEGDVPPDLVNLLPHTPNPTTKEVTPNCPICQAVMVRRGNRNTGSQFWGCSRYRSDGRGCAGHIDSAITNAAVSHSAPVLAKVTISEDDPRMTRWTQITERAVQECGSIEQAKAWLNTSKIALKGETPIEAMTRREGCDAVERLLRELNR